MRSDKDCVGLAVGCGAVALEDANIYESSATKKKVISLVGAGYCGIPI